MKITIFGAFLETFDAFLNEIILSTNYKINCWSF